MPPTRGVPLADLNPLEQLKAGRLPRRFTQLLVGLWLYGFAMSLFIRSGLGLDPWDVFHAGIQRLTGWSFGTVVIVVGFAVLLLWWPLRQWPGVGTVANAVVIGVATDVSLALIPPAPSWIAGFGLLAAGLVINGLGGALYIGAQLGPGPRDGLMTGFARQTGWSLRLIRTAIELTVLAVGWLLGGAVGVGTVLYALAIGLWSSSSCPSSPFVSTLNSPSAHVVPSRRATGIHLGPRPRDGPSTLTPLADALASGLGERREAGARLCAARRVAASRSARWWSGTRRRPSARGRPRWPGPDATAPPSARRGPSGKRARAVRPTPDASCTGCRR